MAEDARSVLDLGCGTGELLAKLAPGRTVVGVDPAPAMLDIARTRPGGNRVTWIGADARDLDLDQQFDLVILTGHMFQVFLTEQDQHAVLMTIARHLAPEGRFVFDTRNPAVERWRDWTPELSKRRLEHPELGEVEAWTDTQYDETTGILTYHSNFRVVSSAKLFTAASKIKFSAREKLAALLGDAGLAVDAWHGDWNGGDCTVDSVDFIPVGRLR